MDGFRKNHNFLAADVAVIGGGPAGCSAALALRAHGRSVAVVNAPSTHEKPTETAAPALRQLLYSIGAEDALSACEPCFGIKSNWGRSRSKLQPSILNPYGHAWFIHRARFDQILRSCTQKMGVTNIDARARDVLFDPDGAQVSLDGHVPIRARWVVFATGSLSWTARITHQKPTVLDPLIAIWSHLPRSLEERILSVEAVEHGWWYVCPRNCSSTIAALITDSANARELNATNLTEWSKLFSETRLSLSFEESLSHGPLSTVQTGLGLLPQQVGPRWIAAGDAALMLDPLGSSGTISALESGRRAGRTISETLGGNSEAPEKYARWCHSLVESFNRQRQQQYSSETRNRRNAFWSRRKHIVSPT